MFSSCQCFLWWQQASPTSQHLLPPPQDTAAWIQNKLPNILNLPPALLIIFQNAQWRGGSRCCGLRARSEDLARESAWGKMLRYWEKRGPLACPHYTVTLVCFHWQSFCPRRSALRGLRSAWRVTPVGVMMETAAVQRKNTKDGWWMGQMLCSVGQFKLFELTEKNIFLGCASNNVWFWLVFLPICT